MPRYYKFCFTLNNYTDLNIENLEKFSQKYLQYIKYGKEIGDSGTPHLQGYVITKKGYSKKDLINLLHSINLKPHIEIMRGDIDQNESYVSKDGDVSSSGTILNLKPNLETAMMLMEPLIDFSDESKLLFKVLNYPDKKHVSFNDDIERLLCVFAQKCPIQYIRHYTGFRRYIIAILTLKYSESQPSITCDQALASAETL